uniref:Sulfotransferase n=1 Tax=Aegilops tauschii TaxID=37682 RepID=M8CC67_AEGTA
MAIPEEGPVPFEDALVVIGTYLVSSPQQREEEHADLVATLPSALEANGVKKLRLYQGFWIRDIHVPAAIALQRQFEPRPDDVIVASLPKCGTTWLNALTFATMARKAYPPASADHPLRRLNPHQCLPFLEGLFKGGREAELELLPYWRASTAMPDKVLFLRYEELLRDPAKNVRKLARFIGMPFSAAEDEAGTVDSIVQLCSFGHLKGLDANKTGHLDPLLPVPRDALFRNGASGDWVNHMMPEMASHLDKIVADKMRGTGLTFQ